LLSAAIIVFSLLIGWIFYLQRRWKQLYLLYKPLYADKFWLIWIDDERVVASPAYQKRFGVPTTGTIESMLKTLPQTQYNNLMQYVNQLDHKPFHLILEHETQFWELWGRNRFNMKVIELTNISHHVHMLKHEEIHAAISQDDTRKHKAVLDCLPLPICLKNAKNDIMFCNYAYAELFNSNVVSVIAQQLRFDNPEMPTPSERNIKVALGGKLRMFKIQSTFLPFDSGTLETIWEQTDMCSLLKTNEDQKKYFHDVCQHLSTPIAIWNENLMLEFFNKAYTDLFKFDIAFLTKHPYFSDVLDDLHGRQKLPEPANFTLFKNKEIEAVKTLTDSISEILHLPNGKILHHTRFPLSSGVIFLYEDLTDTYCLKQQNKILTDVQKYTIDNLFEGILVFGSDHCVQLFNPAVQSIFNLQIFERYHLNDFIKQTNYLLNDLPNLFAKRHVCDGIINPDIRWAYTPLPDGSHMLRFMTIAQITLSTATDSA